MKFLLTFERKEGFVDIPDFYETYIVSDECDSVVASFIAKKLFNSTMLRRIVGLHVLGAELRMSVAAAGAILYLANVVVLSKTHKVGVSLAFSFLHCVCVCAFVCRGCN